MADTSFITASSSSGTYATASSSSASGLLHSSAPISPVSASSPSTGARTSAHLQAPPSDLIPAGAAASSPLSVSHSSSHTPTPTAPADDCAHEVETEKSDCCGCTWHSRSETRLMRANSTSSSTPLTRLRSTDQGDLTGHQASVTPNQQRTVSGNSVLLSPIANIENHTEQARKRLAALDTRSMGVMRRQSKGREAGQRERAYSDSRPAPALAPMPTAQPVAQTKEAKKGGFSAFLRRLTKRKPAKLAPRDVNVPNAHVQEAHHSTMTKTQSRNTANNMAEVMPSSTFSGNPAPSTHTASMSSRHTAASVATVQLLSPAQSIASAHRLATVPSNSSQLGVPLRDVDPVNVPLPPSPNIPEDPSTVGAPEPVQAINSKDGLPRSSATGVASPRIVLPRSRSASPRAYTQAIPIPGHSAAHSLSQKQAQAQAEEDESIETIDEIRPLDSLRIITRARSMSPGQPGPLSAGGSSIAETVLQTPVTMASSPPLTIPSLASAMRSSVADSASDGEISSIPEESLGGRKASETSTGEDAGQDMLQVSGDRETSQERERERTPERESSGSSHGEVEMKEEMKDETTDDVDYLDTPMYAGSSPPRKAPIGSAPPVSLGRKESKWRRSVMGLSDIRNGSLGRKASSRAPPASAEIHVQGQDDETDAFDSFPTRQARTLTRSGTQSYQYQQQYQHQHQRRQNHRVSCQPTLHSNASIAAQVRGIKDDKEKEAAETMFMM